MPVSRAMRRLLRIRELEEEQSHLAFESALNELRRIQDAIQATAARDRNGRQMVVASTLSGELPDRIAGLEEIETAKRFQQILRPRAAEKEQGTQVLRQAYLEKRVERRQAETLIEEAEARDALEADRRTQQMLDDWFRGKQFRSKQEQESSAEESET